MKKQLLLCALLLTISTSAFASEKKKTKNIETEDQSLGGAPHSDTFDESWINGLPPGVKCDLGSANEEEAATTLKKELAKSEDDTLVERIITKVASSLVNKVGVAEAVVLPVDQHLEHLVLDPKGLTEVLAASGEKTKEIVTE